MDNPLLQVSSDPAFAAVLASHIRPATDALIAKAKAAIETIASGADTSYEGTFEALDHATEGLDFAMGIAGHLEAVLADEDLRTEYSDVQGEVSALYSSIVLHEGLFAALQKHAALHKHAGNPVRARHVEKALAEFRRSGAALAPEKKNELSAIDVELTQLTLKYSQNVVDATGAFQLVVEDAAKLAGLPESALAAAAQSASAKGLTGYRFTLAAPSYGPFVTYADDASLREHMYRAANARAAAAPFDNRPLMGKILELRKRKATILGFHDFSDLVLADRMAKNGATAAKFVTDLRARVGAAFEREKAALSAFRQSLEGATAAAIEPWDVAYYAEKQRKALYDFDEETLRPYFELEHVLVGLFRLTEKLYGVRLKQQDSASLWHEDVRCYVLEEGAGDTGTGEVIGRFFLDLFPREGKRDGAWMHGLLERIPRVPHMKESMALIVANMTPPQNGRVLLTHREVQTLFHEFGHLMHQLLSRVDVRSLAGTRVAWDFVELPSQIMENFCWEEETLALIAQHHETGETLPAELLTKLRRARGYRAATQLVRQLGFSTLDLGLHREYDPTRDGDVVTYARGILQGFAPAPLHADFAMIASFSHLFASAVGYAAGYYSYQWAEALDADAFEVFKSRGIVSSEVGTEFRLKILELGDSIDPATLFVNFRGRELDAEAMLRRVDLL